MLRSWLEPTAGRGDKKQADADTEGDKHWDASVNREAEEQVNGVEIV